MNTALKLENKSVRKIKIPKILGINISIAMKQLPITQIELAKKLKITQGEISLWINGKRMPNVLELNQIAEITKKPMEWFLKNNK